MPDAVLCHILSFLFTREAVKTSVLSHRWKNVWAPVPVLDLDEEEYDADRYQPLGYNPADGFAQFVNRVLLFRFSGDIHRFRLVTKDMDDLSLIYAWISTAIRRNVVEFDLTVQRSTVPPFEIPESLFMCRTLVRFKLWLHRGVRVMTPTSSNCFPSLKFLHVTVRFPDSDSMEKLFSRLPVLEELIIDGNFNAKCLHKAKIDFFDVEELKKHDYFLGLADRIHQIFAGIYDAKYLTVKAPLLAALDIGHQHVLPTFNNLNYLELQLHTCRCLQSLATVLKISPHLEHLKISRNRKQMYANVDEGELEPGWDELESVPVCLISHLKTICLWDFQGCPDDMEVAMYLVKHGKALNKVTIYNHFCQDKEIEIQSPIALWSKFSKFPRGSKTCKIQFQTII
ncbi:hypothetical protein ACLB2K_051337 [Fragaria x ananassa]